MFYKKSCLAKTQNAKRAAKVRKTLVKKYKDFKRFPRSG